MVQFPQTIQAESEVKIVPNPVSEYAMIHYPPQGETVQVVLSDLRGNSLKRWGDEGDGVTQVWAGDLPAGMYFVTLQTAKQKLYLKFMRE